jgi:hypothetical protein
VKLKDLTRNAHLDVNGMDIDVEPEDLTTNGELHEVILGGAPKPMDARPSVATLQQATQVILTRLKRCDSGHRLSTICRKSTVSDCWHCHVGSEEIQCWMCHHRLNQATSTVLEKRILEDALSCSLHKI